jgi:hypothetical protein
MQGHIHRSLSGKGEILGVGDTTIHGSPLRLWKVPCGEWPLMKGFEDKQTLNALNVQLDRNSGWPTSRKAHGHGVLIVLMGVTTHQGAWESQAQGEGGQVGKKGWKGDARGASVFHHEPTRKLLVNWRAGCSERCKSGSGRGGWRRIVGKLVSDIPSLSQNRAGRLLYGKREER